MGKKLKNPLKLLWNLISMLGGIISLSNLAQSWIGDLLKWKGFILSIVEIYESAIRPLFNFIFQWLPFNLPDWIHDYLVFGFIIAASEFKVYRTYYNLRRSRNFGEKFIVFLGYSFYFSYQVNLYVKFFQNLFLWPATIYKYPKRIYLYYKRKKRPYFVRHNPLIELSFNSMLWTVTIILGSMILLSINVAL